MTRGACGGIGDARYGPLEGSGWFSSGALDLRGSRTQVLSGTLPSVRLVSMDST